MNAPRKLLLVICVAAAMQPAAAEYPDRPIRFLVSSGAGGSPDITARIFAAELTKQLGQQVVVDNRPGAGSVMGTTLMAKAPPDGYTIGYGTIAPIAIQRSLQPNLPYDPDKDLQAVIQISRHRTCWPFPNRYRSAQ